jgi:hypothetical protein
MGDNIKVWSIQYQLISWGALLCEMNNNAIKTFMYTIGLIINTG